MNTKILSAYKEKTLENQNEIRQALDEMLDIRRLAQGLLFSGLKGTGRRSYAKRLMMLLNCEAETACSLCPSCKKIIRETHPDLILIEAKNGIIGIDKIRELITKLMSRPYEALKRFVIIEEADLLNQEASNALLKILEEAPKTTHFVLLSRQAELLMDTIRSRCQEISFPPLSEESIKEEIEDAKLGQKTRESIARFSCGDIERAKLYAEKSDKYKAFIKVLSEKFPLSNSKAMVLAKSLTSDKNEGSIFLYILEGLLRDLCLVKEENPLLNKYIFFSDCMDEIVLLKEKIAYDKALVLIEKINGMQEAIKRNALPRLQFEAFFLEFFTAN